MWVQIPIGENDQVAIATARVEIETEVEARTTVLPRIARRPPTRRTAAARPHRSTCQRPQDRGDSSREEG